MKERPPDPGNGCAPDGRTSEAQGETTARTAKNSTTDEVPAPFRSRRAFMIWALSGGYISHRRVVERIVAEVEAETHDDGRPARPGSTSMPSKERGSRRRPRS